MTTLNPLGSEKLNSDEKVKRIMEIANYNVKPKKINKNKDAEYIKETSNGVYGIVKEGHSYYVKKGLNESSLDYIGGMFMKKKNQFHSYGDALKRLELISSQDIQEQKKYVLKKPVSDVPMDTPAEPEAPIDAPVDDVAAEPESDSLRSDYMSEIQKHSGALGQSLRDQREKLESDDIKYVINMVLSAVDLNALEDNDREDIASRFETDENPDGADEFSEPDAQDFPDEDEDELGEIIGQLEKFVNNSFDNQEKSVSLPKETPKVEPEEEIGEIDIEQIKNEIGETLSKYFK